MSAPAATAATAPISGFTTGQDMGSGPAAASLRAAAAATLAAAATKPAAAAAAPSVTLPPGGTQTPKTTFVFGSPSESEVPDDDEEDVEEDEEVTQANLAVRVSKAALEDAKKAQQERAANADARMVEATAAVELANQKKNDAEAKAAKKPKAPKPERKKLTEKADIDNLAALKKAKADAEKAFNDSLKAANPTNREMAQRKLLAAKTALRYFANQYWCEYGETCGNKACKRHPPEFFAEVTAAEKLANVPITAETKRGYATLYQSFGTGHDRLLAQIHAKDMQRAEKALEIAFAIASSNPGICNGAILRAVHDIIFPKEAKQFSSRHAVIAAIARINAKLAQKSADDAAAVVAAKAKEVAARAEAYTAAMEKEKQRQAALSAAAALAAAAKTEAAADVSAIVAARAAAADGAASGTRKSRK